MERIAYLLVNMETQRRLRRDADAACKPMLARNFFQIITVKVCWMKNKRERERQENQTTKKGNWKIKPSFTLLEFWKVGPSVDLTRNVCAQKETQELELIAKRITRRKRRSRMKGWMLFCCCKENMKNFSRLLWKEEIQKKKQERKRKRHVAERIMTWRCLLQEKRRSRLPRRNEDPEIWNGCLSLYQSLNYSRDDLPRHGNKLQD